MPLPCELSNMVAVRRPQPCAPISATIHVFRAPMTESSEGDWGTLMAAAQAGNGGAYRRLLAEVRVWLARYYGRRLPLAHVEDAVQDALLALHQKRHTYDPERSFGPWLAAIARYKWIDRLRAMGRTESEALPHDFATGDHESAVTSAAVLHQLMAELKPAQADAIRLVKIEGYSVDEASAKIGQSQSLIKVNIHRGLARLGAIIQGRSHVD